MSGRQHVWEGRKPLPLNLIAQAIPMLSRHELAALADRLIDAIDTCDGDDDLEAEPDLEAEVDCCGAADDGCGPIMVHGFERWGSEYDETRHLGKCNYAEDQRWIVLGSNSMLNADDWPMRL